MSRLTKTVTLLYSMQAADIQQLEAQLLEQRKRAWLTAMRLAARSVGCTKAPNAARLEDLTALRRMSREDAKSIARTYNRELKREVERLYQENRRSNRYTYYKRLEAWVARRNTYKLKQIALVTDTTTVEYARRRFYEVNFGTGVRYVFTGPAPTCADCTTRFAAGIVNQAYIDRFPCPRHIGCPHSWSPVRPLRANCQELWVG